MLFVLTSMETIQLHFCSFQHFYHSFFDLVFQICFGNLSKETFLFKICFPVNVFMLFLCPMKKIELVDPKEIALLERVTEVYVREGLKKITMDDMAKQLNVSKKTLYKYVKNRKELIFKSTYFHVQRERLKIIEIQEKNLNPIMEHHELAKFFLGTISKINPVLHYDMEHYFTETWDFLNEHFNGFIFESIYKNLVRGQAEGLYHKDFNAEIIAKFFTKRVDMVFDGELFPPEKFNFSEVYIEFLVYHLNSITTDEGKATLNQLDFKHL